MSIRAINKAFDADLQPIPKLILLALGNWCDSYGYSWPSIRKLTKITGASRSTVIKWLQHMDSVGIIKIITRPNRSSLYLFPGCDEEQSPLPRDHPAYDWHLEVGPANGPRPGDGPGGPADGPLEVREPDPDTKGDTKETRVKRRSRLSPDWQLSDADRAYAEGRGLAAGELLSEAQRFKNYHLAKGSQMMDWHRAWMMWVQNWEKFKTQREKRQRPAI